MKMNILLMPGMVPKLLPGLFYGALLAWSGLSQAAVFDCSLGFDQRRISLDYPGRDHLCEVSVTRSPKSADAKREVKWYANNSSAFCSTKFDELVEKYQSEWQFSCKNIANDDGLELLSNRHRVLLDSIVKRTVKEGKNGKNLFEIDTVQARAAALTDQTASAVVVQMFMKTVNQSTVTNSDRTYYVIDDGSRYKTSAVAVSLGSKITPLEEGYRIASASINSVLPSGLVEVKTRVFAPEDEGDIPSCEGSQKFSTNNSGRFDPALPHQFSCNE